MFLNVIMNKKKEEFYYAKTFRKNRKHHIICNMINIYIIVKAFGRTLYITKEQVQAKCPKYLNSMEHV